MHIHGICLCLTSLSVINFRSIQVAANGIISFFLWFSNSPLYVCTSHLLYPFFCQWAFRLFPYLGFCKQRCCKHWGACSFSNYGFLQIQAQGRDCWIIWQPYFQFFEKAPYYFSVVMPVYVPINSEMRDSLSSHPFQHMSDILLDFTGMKLEINCKKKTGKNKSPQTYGD